MDSFHLLFQQLVRSESLVTIGRRGGLCSLVQEDEAFFLLGHGDRIVGINWNDEYLNKALKRFDPPSPFLSHLRFFRGALLGAPPVKSPT